MQTVNYWQHSLTLKITHQIKLVQQLQLALLNNSLLATNTHCPSVLICTQHTLVQTKIPHPKDSKVLHLLYSRCKTFESFGCGILVCTSVCCVQISTLGQCVLVANSELFSRANCSCCTNFIWCVIFNVSECCQ